MAYRSDKLLGRIVEVYGTREKFAAELGMSAQTLSKKLNNGSDWRRDEICRACERLAIPLDCVNEYFFARSVKKT